MNRVPTLTALAVAALLLAAVGATSGVLALAQKPATASSRSSYARLTGEVQHLRQQLESEVPIATEVNKLKGTVGKISTCLPELNGQIQGLTPEVASGSVWLQQHAQISHYCHGVLTGE